ncbi:Rgg family transcriptional regulator [Lapidilactobacillus bayanensis]|uniref:Rgg family transcriptional regulator n=1 Tax=Lapidilactobacillus bayanensis TaxID=2485998 RepID=UPI000F798EA9|nr:hypothetical protein [Lapidilactobacillus bayanensis]
MNITVEEYQYLFNRKYPTPKETAKKNYWTIVTNQKLTLTSPSVKAQLQSLLHTYQLTNDFFYYSLYAQLFLIIAYRDRNLDLHDPATLAIQTRIQSYLVKVQNWGRFELVLFTNCLFLFDDEFIQGCLTTSLKQTRFYCDSHYYTVDLKVLIVHGLILSLERQNLDLFDTFFSELTQLQHQSSDAELLIYTRIFDFIHHSIARGIDDATGKVLFDTLKWLNMTEWINYIKKIIALNQRTN